jgi:hypothetical protein
LLPAERELWARHREQLLRQWVADHPGTRPHAWWSLDAPEPRRALGGRGVLLCGEFIRNLRADLDRGLLVFASIDVGDPPRFESEATYLARLGLFLDGERERIPAAAFQPEFVLDDEIDA